MKKITQEEFRKLCTPRQWDEYVYGLISDASWRDTYYRKGDRPLVKADEMGGSSTPILGWDGECWDELGNTDE